LHLNFIEKRGSLFSIILFCLDHFTLVKEETVMVAASLFWGEKRGEKKKEESTLTFIPVQAHTFSFSPARERTIKSFISSGEEGNQEKDKSISCF